MQVLTAPQRRPLRTGLRPLATTPDPAKEARRILESSSLFRGRSHLIHIENHDGILRLNGRLPTFYLKQMLQTILREVDGVTRIENRVSVLRS